MRAVVCGWFVAFAGAAGSDARADDAAPNKPFWAVGPAGGAFGLFVDGGFTAGQFGLDTFAAGTLDVGVSLRWFEASVTGFGGSSFDGAYSGGAFLVRTALRIPVKYVALSFGPAAGYVDVPGHTIRGFAFELSGGIEIDPICHLRIGLLGGWAWVFGDVYGDVGVYEGVFRGALTVGYVMGRCIKA